MDSACLFCHGDLGRNEVVEAFPVGRRLAFDAATDPQRASRDQPLGLGDVRRLALEMALHEEQERRAMEGERAMLEAAWRGAEEVVAIADGLLVDDSVSARLEGLKRSK